MKQFLILLLIFSALQCSLCGSTFATTTDSRISISLPENILKEAIGHIVPFPIENTDSRLNGTIVIEDITDLQLTDQRFSGHITLHGRDLDLVTTVADNDIRLRLGSADIDFDCSAALRYDSTTRTVFIRPMVQEVESEATLQNGDIGKALLLFFNGREFPLPLEKMAPMILETGNKVISTTMDIVDIRIAKGVVLLDVAPKITSSLKKTAEKKGADS